MALFQKLWLTDGQKFDRNGTDIFSGKRMNIWGTYCGYAEVEFEEEDGTTLPHGRGEMRNLMKKHKCFALVFIEIALRLKAGEPLFIKIPKIQVSCHTHQNSMPPLTRMNISMLDAWRTGWLNDSDSVCVSFVSNHPPPSQNQKELSWAPIIIHLDAASFLKGDCNWIKWLPSRGPRIAVAKVQLQFILPGKSNVFWHLPGVL